MYWAQELAKQDEDAELKSKFTEIADALTQNEEKIVAELNEVQGSPVDLKGYFNSPTDLLYEVMRPSATFNEIIDN